MAEWSMAHAWKAKPGSNTEEPQDVVSNIHSTSLVSQAATQCDSVNVGVRGRFETYLTQFLHSSRFQLIERTFIETIEYGRTTSAWAYWANGTRPLIACTRQAAGRMLF